MRILAFILVAVTALAQTPQTRISRSTENFRGVSVVSQKISWASGTHGTYLRTTDGHIWIPDQVPGAESLDFRGVVAFSADEAFLMSSGPGDQSRIYHTLDAGRHWNLQLTNSNPKGFFDSMAFWDRTHGIVLGDPIPDETGQLKFELLITDDGQTWTPIPPSQLPPAFEGESAFAASNTCLAILSSPRSSMNAKLSNSSVIPSAETPGIGSTQTTVIPSVARDPGFAGATHAADNTPPQTQPWKSGASAPDPNIWFATGGQAARVFHSPDRGHTWEVFDTPISHGTDSTGIFSIAFRDSTHGAIAGGDYKHPEQDGPNLAFTNDGGKTWTLSRIFPQSYYSAVAYDRKNPARLFIVDPKFVYDFRPPKNPTRISPQKKSEVQFNAVSSYPQGGALFVGPKGSLVTLP